jgi:hypothetical protein
MQQQTQIVHGYINMLQVNVQKQVQAYMPMPWNAFASTNTQNSHPKTATVPMNGQTHHRQQLRNATASSVASMSMPPKPF